MAKRMRIWENENPGPVMLSTIFQWALREGNADTLLATERSSMGRSRSFDPRITQTACLLFEQHLIKRFNARGWPGTELIGHSGIVYVVRFNEQVANRMIATENELFKWVQSSPKRLVEDICLLRNGNDYPLFASVTHEKDAYIVSEGAVSLPGFVRTDYEMKEMLLAWDGPYLCLPWVRRKNRGRKRRAS